MPCHLYNYDRAISRLAFSLGLGPLHAVFCNLVYAHLVEKHCHAVPLLYNRAISRLHGVGLPLHAVFCSGVRGQI